ncbi:deoxyribonuclease V [Niabella insulamsoli]|uniref:deoxyribonuclease V n=1 Tax=Niabella insulamsoli TaxID=3144874 RepID=UPI0031FDB31B
MINPATYDQLSASEAIQLQKEMRAQVDLTPLKRTPKVIGGADISFNKFEETVYAGIVLLSYPDMKFYGDSRVIAKTKFPYISGLLAFREVPALWQAWNQLTIKPDVLILDGQGIAHRRRMGIATHFGMIADTPAIGCAKSRLTGTFTEPTNEPFAHTPLMDKEEQIGYVFRSKRNCKPLFISPGHQISMAQSLDIITTCMGRYRMPEPTRLAHQLVNEIRIADKPR